MFISGSPNASPHAKLRTYEEGYMLPVLSADELLFSSRHKGLMRQLRDMLSIPDDQFDALYRRLLNRFFEFVQVLPAQQNGILGSLLNYGLARATVALQKFLQQKEVKTTPLLNYAVFSAALLKDLGRVVSQQHITLVDADGNYLSDWNPFSGSMVGQADFYKIYQISQRYLRIESEVTPMLARQILPREGFLWISSDVAIFSDWLAALLDEEGVAAKKITWALELIKREDLIAMLSTLDGALVDMTLTDGTELGESFLKWLKEGLESGEIALNSDEVGVHVVEDGLYLDRKIFKQFADLTSSDTNFQVVYAQFGNLMGIPKKCGDDYLNAQYFSGAEIAVNKSSAFTGALSHRGSQHLTSGLLLGDPGMILMHQQVPAVSHLMKANQLSTPAFHKEPPVIDSPSLGLKPEQQRK